MWGVMDWETAGAEGPEEVGGISTEGEPWETRELAHIQRGGALYGGARCLHLRALHLQKQTANFLHLSLPNVSSYLVKA